MDGNGLCHLLSGETQLGGNADDKWLNQNCSCFFPPLVPGRVSRKFDTSPKYHASCLATIKVFHFLFGSFCVLNKQLRSVQSKYSFEKSARLCILCVFLWCAQSIRDRETALQSSDPTKDKDDAIVDMRQVWETNNTVANISFLSVMSALHHVTRTRLLSSFSAAGVSRNWIFCLHFSGSNALTFWTLEDASAPIQECQAIRACPPVLRQTKEIKRLTRKMSLWCLVESQSFLFQWLGISWRLPEP